MSTLQSEDAFWGLVQICEKYLPGYYSAGLEAIQLDGEILFALLRHVSPSAHQHLKKHKMEPILYMTEWLMCAFSRTLPWASVLRVWDMFFCKGDRGYPLKPWLLTPIAHPQTPEETHFNTVHARARSVVEHTIGMLKGRWRCLDASGGKLLYEPSKVCQIILACCVLHNISVSHGLEMHEDELRMDMEDPPPLPADWNAHATTLSRRRHLIHMLFQQVLELPVSERDVEKEHHGQLRRWKEMHSELRCKSPPRMHGARAIMAAEPPSQQDLRQNPTIIVESPLAPSSSPPPRTPVKEEEERKKGQQTRNEELANPYPQPLLRDKPLQGSTQSLSSTEHDTYL